MTSGFEAFGSDLPPFLHFVLCYFVLVCSTDVLSDLAAVMAAADDTAALQALVTSYKESCDKLLAEKTPGPTDEAGVAEKLRDKASLQQAVKDHGLPWLFEVKEKGLFPAAFLRDDDFMECYLELRKSGTVVAPSTSADELASATHLVSKASPTTLPATVPVPSTPGTLPFAAALAGRHIRFELPKPSKFSRIAADSDIRAWLVGIHQYLTITGVEQSVWVVFASNLP